MKKQENQFAAFSKSKAKKIWSEAFAENIVEKRIPLMGYLIFIVIVNIALIVTVLVLSQTKKLPPQIPLFYGSPEGEEQLALNWLLTFPSIISLSFISINTALAYFLKDEFLKKSLIAGVFIVSILSLVTTIKIIMLVSSF